MSIHISDAFRVWENAPRIIECALGKTEPPSGSIRGVYRLPNEEVEWIFTYEGTKKFVTGYTIKEKE